jgi:hypothetical protein
VTRRKLATLAALVAAALVVVAVIAGRGGSPRPDRAQAPHPRRFRDPREVPPPAPRNRVLDRAIFPIEDPPRHDEPLRDQPPPPDPDLLPTPPPFGEKF